MRRPPIPARPDPAARGSRPRRASRRPAGRRSGAGRPQLLSGPFWLMMALAAASLIAAVVVGTLGPRLFPPRPAPSIAVQSTASPHPPR
jgi:hypothetical protein